VIPPRAVAARARLPAPPPQAVSVELEIPFADVDALGVAWFGNYPRYVDLARTALLRARRLDNDELAAHGVVFMVSESYIRHAAPLRYAERARATAWFVEVDGRLRIGFQLRNLSRGEALAAEGWLVLVAVRLDGELCLELPEEYVARLRAPGPGSAGPG
jgi:acyl-CoA thioester hydrolase